MLLGSLSMEVLTCCCREGLKTQPMRSCHHWGVMKQLLLTFKESEKKRPVDLWEFVTVMKFVFICSECKFVNEQHRIKHLWNDILTSSSP